MSAPDANGWFDIETAPGTDAIILITRNGRIVVGHWLGGKSRFWATDAGSYVTGSMTHWHPLPKPPVCTTNTIKNSIAGDK